MSVKVTKDISRGSGASRICALLVGTAVAAWGSYAAAQSVSPAQSATQAPSNAAPSDSPAAISQVAEVVVTANKRTEKVLDVPASVQAISGDRLQTLNVTSLTDLAGFVPSLTLSNYGAPGANTLEIRGLGDGYLSDFAGPLVATYIDDFAVGSSTSAGRGNLFGLDLIPYDIDRVEVLEGPQGTLYGADAMGGLIKYGLKQPSLSQFSGGIGGDAAHEDNSQSADYEARGYVNIPLVEDQLGLRVSLFDKNNAGYIDNVGISKHDSNASNEDGGRAALLWQPNEKLSVKASVLFQDIHSDDLTNVLLNGSTGKTLYGRYDTDTAFAQPLEQHTRYYTLGVAYNLGFATLNSVVGYSQLDTSLHEDFSYPYATYTGIPGALGDWEIHDHVNKYTEETRLTSPDQGRISWIVGQFYTHEGANEHDTLPTFTSTYAPLPAADNVLMDNSSSVYEEVSVFGDVTIKLTDHLDITGGGRFTHYSQDVNGSSFGLFGTGVAPLATVSGDEETWLANARYHINSNQMIYFRAATGFRPGTPNPPVLDANYPLVSKADTTTDYELGYKASLFHNRAQLTATIFHIDWDNLQEEAFDSKGLAYITNSSSAISNGLELSGSYRITPELTLGANTAFTDAHLTADAPPVQGLDGNQLPLSAKFVGSATADYVHHLDDQWSLIAGGAYRHKGRIVNQFEGTGEPLPLGPQDLVDVYVGATSGAYSIRLYGKNITNDRSYTGLQYLLNYAEPRAVPVQPATVGLSLDYRFK